MKQDVSKLNFWVKKVTYLTMRTAQDFFNPNKLKLAFAVANSECYGTCGDDYDTGCASNSDCSACSSDDGGDDD